MFYCYSLIFTFNEHAEKEVLELWRYWMIFGKSDSLFYLFKNAENFVGGPWMPLEEQKIEADAQGPDVGLKSVLILAENLRAHKLVGARKGNRFFIKIVFVDHLGHSKIRYLDVALMNKNIFRLDISVDDFLVFHVFESDGNLSEVFLRHWFWQNIMFQDFIFKSSSIAILKDQIERG